MQKNNLQGATAYLANKIKFPVFSSVNDLLQKDILLNMLNFVTIEQVKRNFLRYQEETKKVGKAAWKECVVDLVQCAKSHIVLSMANFFAEGIQTVNDKDLVNVLNKLFCLFCLVQLENQWRILLEEGKNTSVLHLLHERCCKQSKE